MGRDRGIGVPPTKKKKPPAQPGDTLLRGGGRDGQAPRLSRTPRDTAPVPAVHHPDPAVIQRQRLLKARGYPVVIDGIWGPSSRHAWDQYQSSLRPPKPVAVKPTINRADVAERQHHVKLAAQSRLAAANARKLAAAADHRRAVIAEVARRHEIQLHLSATRRALGAIHGKSAFHPAIASRAEQLRHQIATERAHGVERDHSAGALATAQLTRQAVDFAATARSKPVEKLSTRELLATTVDPITGTLDPQKPNEVRRVQRWLRAHGHPSIAADGVWSKETHSALLAAFDQMKHDEERKQEHYLKLRYYDTGIVKVGQPLGPIAHVPAPGEMLKLLHSGFTGSMLWKELNERALTGNAAWLSFQDAQLNTIERSLLPDVNGVNSFRVPDFITKGHLDTRVADLQLNAVAAVRSGTWSDATAKAFVRQVGALGAATDANDLRRRLETIKREVAFENQQRIRKQLEDKGHVNPVWGGVKTAFGVLGKPAEWVSTSVEQVYFAIKDAPEQFNSYFHGHGAEDPRQRALEFQEQHPWIELGLEVALDPLWLVKPVSIVGTGLQATTLTAARLERVGLTLEEGGKISRAVAPALGKPADAIRGFQLAGERWRAGQFGVYGRALQLDHLHGVAEKLTTEKTKMVAKVNARLRVRRRNGFRDIDKAIWGGNPDIGTVAFDLEQRRPLFRAARQALAKEFVQLLHKAGASIFTDVHRQADTVYGRMLRARITAGLRVHALQQLAVDEGHIAYVLRKYGADETLAELLRTNRLNASLFDAILSGTITDVSETTLARFQRVRDAYGQPLLVAEKNETVLRDAARLSFRDVMRRGGSFWGVADRWVEEQLGSRVDELSDLLGDVLADAQDELEELADAALKLAKENGVEGATGLYDDSGKWVGAGGDVQEFARAMGRDAFDLSRPIRNVNHADEAGNLIEHTLDSMLTLRNVELSRYATHVRSGAAVQAAEGVANLSDDFVEGLIQKKADELDAAWQRIPGTSKFTDSRPEIQVPAMYLRHLRDAISPVRHLLKDEDIPADLRKALAIADAPGPAQMGAMEQNVEALTRFIARSRSLTFRERGFVGGKHDFLIRDLDIDSPIQELGRQFGEQLDEYGQLLDRAEAYAKPKEMLREWAIWSALAHAQTRPLRVLYKSLAVSLDAWLTLTLPLRPGFVVRNVVDNTAKSLVQGAIDPRHYFTRVGDRVVSAFSADVEAMRFVLSLGGRFQRSPALHYFDALLDTFWKHDGQVIRDVLNGHQIDVPESVLGQYLHVLPDTNPGRVRRFRDFAYKMMAERPENFSRKALFRSEYAAGLRDGLTEMQAFERAMDKVDFTLFDYSKVTVLEDNLRQIAPFIQFWRKNFTFWTVTMAKNPALPASVSLFEDTLQNDANGDLPAWMRRYVNISPVTNAIARVPGLSWLLPGLQDGLQTDPLNFFSFNALYRTFKDGNPELPADKQGLRFIAPFVDAINAWGVSLNPLFRKPLEVAGVFNYRAWQNVFPEESLIDVLGSKAWFKDRAEGFHLEAWLTDKVVNAIGFDAGAQQRIADNFNQWVQLEMAAQAERGEPVSRDKAVEKIQNYYAVQTVLGFFAGMYARRRDEADVYLYKIAEALHDHQAEFTDLSAKDRRAYSLFKRRKMDALSFDRYLETLPAIEAYYSLAGADYQTREAFKARHPEIIPYVSPIWRGKPFSDSFISHAPLLADQDSAFKLFQWATEIGVPGDARQLAEAAFVTPELQRFWDADATTGRMREKMLQGEVFRHLRSLNDAYFTIPETDFDARESFLRDNPILAHWWNANNSSSDDLKTVLNATNATLRERYFELLDAKDFAGARDLLHRFPFIFEFTKAAGRVTPDGDWLGHASAGGQHGRDFIAAKPYLDYYFKLPQAARISWLRSRSIGAQAVLAYFRKYGQSGRHGLTAHARDYLKAKPYLTTFFNLLKNDPDAAKAWLNGDSDEAAIVRSYFRRYASPSGASQHALDYGKAKNALAHYFNLKNADPDAAKAWLRGGSRASLVVLAYFKKYGKQTQYARRWKDSGLDSADPELNARLAFWKRYWELPPDERPSFVQSDADAHGVFVYGRFGEQERKREQADFLRRAALNHLTPKVALAQHLRPLLDLYFTLQSPSDKALFLRANPDVQEYLDQYGSQPTTGNKQLDSLIEGYFKLPRRSLERTAFIHAHPELQDYFDRHSTEADRAMHNLLEVYFQIPAGAKRSRYSQQHPEISAYFDKRRAERNLELQQAEAFDLADPRLAAFRDFAQANTARPGLRMLSGLREGVARNKFGDTLETRRERRPLY